MPPERGVVRHPLTLDAAGEGRGVQVHQMHLAVGVQERGQVEVAPLAFMRGRSLNDSFIILDEAQNTTPEQMKMFLTRLGNGSRMVVNGDITQVDLPSAQRSGLVSATEILEGVEDIGFVRLDRRDVVRHRLVQRIVDAYGAAEGAAP